MHEIVSAAFMLAANSGLSWKALWVMIELAIGGNQGPLVDQAFSILKDVIIKQGRPDWAKLEQYGLDVVKALLAGSPIPEYAP